ncbi:uncharacterized protein LOC111328215 isoform X2 [Stylophora pistillata]|uniref:uncharacterized protein LOC111328215 isoform X2 n=1 Tax=Stylophora pistillata TaxID=50429 RepID=UPI000C03B22A|nr:uncharacterized protein LOC111328215 isoform X2 [Stylophora pistillata]
MATQSQRMYVGGFDEKPTSIPDYRRPTTKRMRLEKAKDERAGGCDKAGLKSPSFLQKKRECIEKTKDEGGRGGDKAGAQFSSPLQDQKNCQDIPGKGVDGKIEDNSDPEDSWSSDEGEGISVEELKQTEGYQLFREALQAHAKNSAKSV